MVCIYLYCFPFHLLLVILNADTLFDMFEGSCFGCIRDRDLKHPTSGAYLAGREYPHYSCEEIDSDDDDDYM